MTEKIINTTIEILGKYYPVRCKEEEVKSLEEAAQYLHDKMLAVQESGKAINLERIAIMTALNMAHELLQTDQQKVGFISKINARIAHLQDKLDSAFKQTIQPDFQFHTDGTE